MASRRWRCDEAKTGLIDGSMHGERETSQVAKVRGSEAFARQRPGHPGKEFEAGLAIDDDDLSDAMIVVAADYQPALASNPVDIGRRFEAVVHLIAQVDVVTSNCSRITVCTWQANGVEARPREGYA